LNAARFERNGIMRIGDFLFIAVAVMLSAAPAGAFDDKDAQDCNQRSDTDLKIEGCTRLLKSDNLPVRLRVDAFNKRGIGWNWKSEYDRAIADFNEAIRLDPKYAYAYENRGDAWIWKGEYDRAIADLNVALRLDPTFVAAYVGRADAWKEKREFARAIDDYNKAISLNPKQFNAYNNRGLYWSDRGDFDRALADFDEAIRIDPNSRLAFANRGEVWRRKGDLVRALEDLDQAIRLGPTSVIAYQLRGDTLRYKGELGRAMADYDQALHLVPDYVPAFTGRGLTYEKMGDLARARGEFEKALASQNQNRSGIARSALETARARLAALDSGAPQPAIPAVPAKRASTTSIPTPTAAVPVVTPATAIAQGRRVALVIGNSAYKNVPALLNPQRDAEAIAAALRAVGFNKVVVANDTSLEKLTDSLRAFSSDAESADWAMVYYAGHGIEIGGINYLVPVDAKLAVDRDIDREAIPLSQVLKAASAARKLKLVILDACRDNPFTTRKTETAGPIAAGGPTAGATTMSRSAGGRGLAEVKVQGGTLVVFAARDGQVALDGEGGNSPFAVAIVQRISAPGVEINKLFRLVRDDVMEATAGLQEPYTYGSLPGKEDFFFVAR
jgi:tetratricopeptide (TPR) repeat protein